MKMNLESNIFELVKNGSKNIEVRLNDEKRRQLRIGDKLTFIKRPEMIETITTNIIGLDYYDNFNELIKYYDISNLYEDNYTKEQFIELLSQFYSIEEQKEYGVVARIFEKE